MCVLERRERPVYILEMMDHPVASLRGFGYGFWESLPKKVVYSRLVKGLSDPNKYIREESAAAFAEDIGNKEDIPFLKKRLEVEKDEAVLDYLKKAVGRLDK
jgi:hypothetical protein